MAKVSKRFQFTYPITQKIIVNGITTNTLKGNITIEGIGYERTNTPYSITSQEDRYDFDIDIMQIQGTDIIFLQNHLSEKTLEDIHQKAHKHVMQMFYEENMQAFYYQMEIEEQMLNMDIEE